MSFRNTLLIAVIVGAVIIGGLLYVLVSTPKPKGPAVTGTPGQPGTNTASVPPPAPSTNASPNPPVQASLAFKSYRNSAMGFSMEYPARYFISSTFETSNDIKLKLNKVADKAALRGLILDRTAHLEFLAAKHTTGLSLESVAQLWGGDIIGSRFRQANSCHPRTIGGESALKCSVYASVERGGYVDIAFVKHHDRAYQFELKAPTSDDIIHADLNRILATIAWTN